MVVGSDIQRYGCQEVGVNVSWYKGVIDINSCLGLLAMVIPRYRGACDYDKVTYLGTASVFLRFMRDHALGLGPLDTAIEDRCYKSNRPSR